MHELPGGVLIVDDAPENLRLLAAILKRGGLVPRPVTRGTHAIEAALVDPPELVLLDVRMPGMSGHEVCRWFKRDERLRTIPIIFISGLQGTDDKLEAFRVGGVDYISKPFHEQEVLARIKTHLHLRRLQVELATQNLDLEERIARQLKIVTASHLATIFALARLAEARDGDVGGHLERVQRFARALAQQMQLMHLHRAQLTPAFVENLFQAASLHDIGKVGTPDAVLLKPGPLTAGEFAQMKEHCALGASTLGSVLNRYPENELLRMGVDVARSHHERWDGRGYPDGLKGLAIPLSARIVAVADFYDAMTSKRCYREAFTQDDARRMVDEGDGVHFEPAVVAAFSALGGLQALRVNMEQLPATREARM